MKKVLFYVFVLFILNYFFCSLVFCKTKDENFSYLNFSQKELLRDLSFSERQIFSKIFDSEDIINRLERLEVAVFGAIQNGEIEYRIKRLRNSVTNISSGGKGLQYNTLKTMSLVGNSIGNYNWQIGNSYNNHNYFRGENNFSHRVSPPPFHSHRLPPPPSSPNSSNGYYGNGNFYKDYSMGTGVKILDD